MLPESVMSCKCYAMRSGTQALFYSSPHSSPQQSNNSYTLAQHPEAALTSLSLLLDQQVDRRPSSYTKQRQYDTSWPRPPGPIPHGLARLRGSAGYDWRISL